jgi:hypothetical protein
VAVRGGAGQAGPAGRLRPNGEGERGWLGRKGGGHGWAENRSWANVQEIKSFRILFGIWIFCKV